MEEDASIHAVMACEMWPEQFWSADRDLHKFTFPRLRQLHVGRADEIKFPSLLNTSPGIYPIVDELRMLEELLDEGAGIVQLRVKELSSEAQRTVIRAACRMAEQAPRSQLFINDYWRAAIDSGAFGVHLGQEDLAGANLQLISEQGLRLGVSTHSYWEVSTALSIEPSYMACGPIFPTRAKVMDWRPQGLENLRYWVEISDVPVVGIAGINSSNLSDVASTGVNSAAVIQAIVGSKNPRAAYRELQLHWLRALEETSQPSGAERALRDGYRWVPARPTLVPTVSF
jgi:hydroxymethylpyrimidine kinase/phosphomethylpyrimidine kinase/thiamine-phosphate diphosphorylase